MTASHLIGNQVVCPGDILVGDGDGIIGIKPEDAPELLEKTRMVSDKETKIMETMLQDGTYIRPWVDEELREIGCDF